MKQMEEFKTGVSFNPGGVTTKGCSLLDEYNGPTAYPNYLCSNKPRYKEGYQPVFGTINRDLDKEFVTIEIYKLKIDIAKLYQQTVEITVGLNTLDFNHLAEYLYHKGDCTFVSSGEFKVFGVNIKHVPTSYPIETQTIDDLMGYRLSY